MESFNNISFEIIGQNQDTIFVWGHGWGQSHQSFMLMARSLELLGQHIMIDFPGFGQSPPPPEAWGTKEYADAMTELIKEKAPNQKIIWIGHSFGCRVGLQLAIHYPELIKGLFLIGGAGLRRKRGLIENMVLYSKIYTFKTCKKLIPLGLNEEWLKSKFGSPDYRNAGPMRPIMLKVNAEDLTETVPKITCPVTLAYGKEDTETPVEIGTRLNKLIPGSELVVLDGLDHYNILGEGRHQVLHLIKRFTEDLKA